MAREVIIKMTDDLDRVSPADEVIEFVYEGLKYTLDLTEQHADEFRAAIEPYVQAAHESAKVKVLDKSQAQALPTGVGVRKTFAKSPEGETKEQRMAIRKWAADNGFPGNPQRGIISREVREAYEKATGVKVAQNVPVFPEPVAGQLPFSENVRQATGQSLEALRAIEAAVTPKKKAESAKPKQDKDSDDIYKPNVNGVSKHMRDWAREKGYPVKGGYITADVREIYYQEMATAKAGQNGRHE